MAGRSLVLVCCALGLISTCGCQSTSQPAGYAVSSNPTPRPKPRTTSLDRIPVPTRVAVIVSSVSQDTNGDGYGDRVSVSALLFGSNSPDPVFSSGTFIFELVQPAEGEQPTEIIKSWVFDAQAVRKAEGPTMFGLPGYRFELDLGQVAVGMEPASANLLTGFSPTNGGPAVMPTQDRRLVRVGPVG